MALKQIEDHAEWIKKATLEELVDKVIWESVMENTAWCGWTDRARDGFVESVRDSVKWALNQKKQSVLQQLYLNLIHNEGVDIKMILEAELGLLK